MIPPVVREFARTTMSNFAQLTNWLTGDQSYFMTNYEAFQRNQRLIQEMRTAKDEMTRARDDLVRAAAEKDKLFRDSIDAKFQLFDNRVDIVQKFVDDCRAKLDSFGSKRGGVGVGGGVSVSSVPAQAAAGTAAGIGAVAGVASSAPAVVPPPPPTSAGPRRRASVVDSNFPPVVPPEARGETRTVQPACPPPTAPAVPGATPAPAVQASGFSADSVVISRLSEQLAGLEQRYSALMSEVCNRTDRNSREAADLQEHSRTLFRRLGEQAEQSAAFQKQLSALESASTATASGLQSFASESEARGAALEARVEALEQGLKEVEALRSRVEGLEEAVRALSSRLDAFSGHLSALSLKEDESRSMAQELDRRQGQRHNALAEAVQAVEMRLDGRVSEVAGEVRALAEGMDSFSEDLSFQVNNVKNLVAGAHLLREYEVQRRKELETMAEDLQDGRRDAPALLAPMELRLRRLENLLLDHLSTQYPRAASPAGRAPRPASAAPWIN